MSLSSNKKYSDHLSKLQEQNGEECEDGAEEIEDSRPKKVYKRNRKKERLRKLIRSRVLLRRGLHHQSLQALIISLAKAYLLPSLIWH